MLANLEGRVAGSGGSDAPSTPSLFDVTTQLWPYLDCYDQLAIRQSCREGLGAHDCLVATLSVHDLWGRVLPGAPQEIAEALRRAVKRRCSPREVVLRLRGCSATAREARGLAVLGAFGPTGGVLPGQRIGCGGNGGGGSTGGGSRAASGDSTSGSNRRIATCGSDVSGHSGISHGSCSAGSGGGNDGSNAASTSAGGIASLRMEGVPLTPRVLCALAAFGRGLTRIKLYSYDLNDDGGAVGVHSGHPESAPPPQLSTHSPGQSRQRQVPPPQRCNGAAAAGAAESWSSAPTHGSPDARGAAALLRLLVPQLQELTLQDCSISASARTGASAVPDLSGGGSGGGSDPGSAGDGDGGGGAAAGDRADVVGSSDCTYCSICGGCRFPSAAAPVLDALRSCTALRHLGLRHTDTAGCPLLQLLLRPDVCRCGGGGGGGSGNGRAGRDGGSSAGAVACSAVSMVGQEAATIRTKPRAASERSAGGDVLLNGCGGGGGAVSKAGLGVGPTPAPAPPRPAPSPAGLASLTQLTSLKIQTPLPAPGGVGALTAALVQLTGLTRLELGERTAVPSVAALLLPAPSPSPLQPQSPTASPPLPPPLVLALRNLRDLSLVSAHLTSAAELAALAALRELTRVSLGALCLPSVEMEPGAGLAAAAAAAAEAAATDAGERAWMSLPPLLRELSVAAPLPPATLLALRRPSILRTLRLTGFTLGMCDADGEDIAAGDDGRAPLAMAAASQRQLTEAIRLLHGRFEYRDLGIELHIGFHGPAAGRRRYLAAPATAAADADRPGGHWAWASCLVPLALQGLELAGLELREADVEALAGQLWTLEDLRLDCRYPLHAMAHLSALRRLRRLLLNASFWQSQPQGGDGLPPPPLAQQQQQGQGPGEEQGPQPQPQHGQGAERSDAHVAAAALTSLCGAAPECLYDVALASYGRATSRFCAMQALVRVESELPRVGCGALRVWVCP
ncbi:hypothetical protein PLESTB_000554000 [Pleodorina starrii]|uniref:Uncharacterized protein n=1 Tax=Pleodorina starrii TaxID=330485 RepID=A0A9W6F0H4_9CHLO|nr:hypothetical protein PLESTB_000554000 [Pleodorina starrii]GLC74518.1 hypothetical protein PLESTF_001522800 [Pleodorina starrii]